MINISNLSFSYGREPVLEDINLFIESGKTYGMLGPNGAGKTTLLSLLAGLKKPTCGEISIDGLNPFDREPSFLANMYFLTDEVVAVSTQVDIWAKQNGGFRPNFSFESFLAIMDAFKTPARKKINTLSWGQRKKANIAFAIACKPKYLLMDEPTSGLDIPSKMQFVNIISDFCNKDCCTIISTHQLRDLEELFELVILLNDKHAELHNEGKGTYSNLFL